MSENEQTTKVEDIFPEENVKPDFATFFANKFGLSVTDVKKAIKSFETKQKKTKAVVGTKVVPEAVKEPSSGGGKPKIVRDKDNKQFWIVEGTKIVVQSPRKPTVLGYINRSNELAPKLTPTLKKKAVESGLSLD